MKHVQPLTTPCCIEIHAILYPDIFDSINHHYSQTINSENLADISVMTWLLKSRLISAGYWSDGPTCNHKIYCAVSHVDHRVFAVGFWWVSWNIQDCVDMCQCYPMIALCGWTGLWYIHQSSKVRYCRHDEMFAECAHCRGWSKFYAVWPCDAIWHWSFGEQLFR